MDQKIMIIGIAIVVIVLMAAVFMTQPAPEAEPLPCLLEDNACCRGADCASIEMMCPLGMIPVCRSCDPECMPACSCEPETGGPEPRPEPEPEPETEPEAECIANSDCELTCSCNCISPLEQADVCKRYMDCLSEAGVMGCECKDGECTQTKEGVYDPQINPADFSMDITNPYFSMPVGKKMVYEAETEDGVERVETMIPGWTKTVMGVETLVFWDRVYLDDELIEDTRDYIAQDKEGNVWYFGEDVDNYAGGLLADHGGAWLSGVDGAKPGTWLVADPKVGDYFRQEYYEGEAEDTAKVEAVGVTVTIPLGTYSDCAKVLEWNPLEKAGGYKYHCSEVGGTALEEEDEERVELIELDMDAAKCLKLPSTYSAEGVKQGPTAGCAQLIEIPGAEEPKEEVQTELSRDDAKAIALTVLNGTITDVGIEWKKGRLAYVVEMQTSDGEIDVIIDKDTGEVLGIED